MVLKAEHIFKKIGRKVILNDISMELETGKIYGIVGNNGAGKTMLFRALSGLMKIDSGTISWGDKKLHMDFDILPKMGIALENAGLYPEMTGIQNLRYLAGVNKKITEEDMIATIIKVGLDPKDKRAFRKYSLGMKQRIVLAQAIMEKPDILFLDEPTNALDENGVKEIRKLIQEEKERGALILLASHNAADIEILADKVYYIKNGELEEKTDEN